MKKKIIDFLNLKPIKEPLQIPRLSADTNVLAQLKEFIHYSEFKRILDKVVTHHLEHKTKSIAILSELPGEGKTLFTAALAAGLSELLKIKILVVNTQTFQAPNHMSLEHALEIDELFSGTKKPIQKTLLVNTDVLPASSLQEAKTGLTEYKIGEIIEKYTKVYGLLIFDTSALSARNKNNIDPWVIARHVDTNLLVVGRHTIRKNLSPHFYERKSTNNLKIAGLIFNEGTRHE